MSKRGLHAILARSGRFHFIRAEWQEGGWEVEAGLGLDTEALGWSRRRFFSACAFYAVFLISNVPGNNDNVRVNL